MNKSILIISLCFFLSLSGCTLTSHMFDAKNYEEVISSIFITEDSSQLVIMTNDFHYVFGTPSRLKEILNSEYNHCLDASFSGFNVNTDNSIKGNVHIYIKRALKKGFSEKTVIKIETDLFNKNEKITFALQGKRYRAKDLQPKTSQYALNKPYRIHIVEDLSVGEKLIRVPLTPITVVGDTLIMGGYILVLLPVIALSDVH